MKLSQFLIPGLLSCLIIPLQGNGWPTKFSTPSSKKIAKLSFLLIKHTKRIKGYTRKITIKDGKQIYVVLQNGILEPLGEYFADRFGCSINNYIVVDGNNIVVFGRDRNDLKIVISEFNLLIDNGRIVCINDMEEGVYVLNNKQIKSMNENLSETERRGVVQIFFLRMCKKFQIDFSKSIQTLLKLQSLPA